nr:glycosyltransferase family 2 protein [uncultured Dorea sp.]
MRKEKYSVDVVIPTYKPDSKFDKLLFMLQRQQYPIENIWIINTKAGKFPKQIKETDQIHIHHIEPKDFDHGATRDKGMQMSNAEIVVFMTQDAVPEDEFVIGKLVEALDQDEKIGAAYAKQLAENGCNIIETYTRTFNYPEKSMIKTAEDIPRLGIKTFFCSNVCAAYRRSVYEKMGGFCKRTIFNEDMILAGNMVLSGYKIAYAAEAKVIHSHNYTGMQQFHRNFDMAVSQAEHPEVFNCVKSEKEGIKLVKMTAEHLLRIKKGYLIPKLIYQSGCKFIGYKLGRNYKKLPEAIVKWCTMSPNYWKKN